MLIVVVHLGLGRFSIQNLAFFVSLSDGVKMNPSHGQRPIEIDGLPFLKLGGSFHGYVK